MNRKVILHKSAVEELNLIKQRVYELFGYNVANKVVKNLIQLMKVLSVNPYLGTKDERYSPFFILHSKHNRIFYLVEDNEIMIVAIWDNRKNEENLQDMLSKRISE